MTSLIFDHFSYDLYLLRWNILYTICILPLATLILIPMEDTFYGKKPVSVLIYANELYLCKYLCMYVSTCRVVVHVHVRVSIS